MKMYLFYFKYSHFFTFALFLFIKCTAWLEGLAKDAFSLLCLQVSKTKVNRWWQSEQNTRTLAWFVCLIGYCPIKE